MIGPAVMVAVGYLLGSIPFGYLAGWLRGVDLRGEGSGNTGATNAIRVLGPKLGVPVLVLDLLKGVGAVVIAETAVGGVGVAVVAAAAAMLGHTFPLFLGFGGGKGVATGCGATLALAPIVGVLSVPVWIGVSLLTGYISVGSLVTAVAIPSMAFAFDEPWQVKAFLLGGSALVFWRHRANIARLRSHTENRINLRDWWERRAAARAG